MRTVVKMDEKGRIQLPAAVRKKMKLRPRQAVVLEINDDSLLLRTMTKPDKAKDKVLHDIFVNPGRSKVKLTTGLLNAMKEEILAP